MTSHQRGGVADAIGAVSHPHLCDLHRRRRRHFQLPNDFRVGNCQVVAALVRARVVVAAQLTSAVCVLTIFTVQLIFNRLITVLTRRAGRQTFGARRQREFLRRRCLDVGIAFDLAGGVVLAGLGHLAFTVVFGARFPTFGTWREEFFAFLQGGRKQREKNLIRKRFDESEEFFSTFYVLRFVFTISN